jgi:hypothetical protein
MDWNWFFGVQEFLFSLYCSSSSAAVIFFFFFRKSLSAFVLVLSLLFVCSSPLLLSLQLAHSIAFALSFSQFLCLPLLSANSIFSSISLLLFPLSFSSSALPLLSILLQQCVCK